MAMNALDIQGSSCAAAQPDPRRGWPPLAGDYTVLRYRAPVAVCTLTDGPLAAGIATAGRPDEVSTVGTLQTENIGIERLVLNILSNPNIRFLVVCGPDSLQAVGHLPGQSLVALARSGVDAQTRIIGASGKRPFVRNLSPTAVGRFRQTVEVVDMIGMRELKPVLAAIAQCAARSPGPAEPYDSDRGVPLVRGEAPLRMVPDPAGYCIIYADRRRGLLSMEHYSQEGVLDLVVEGPSAAEVYMPAVDRGLLTRLDHAAYVGRELARAEHALSSGDPYVQDAAPERCGGHCVKAACCPPPVTEVRSKEKGGHE